MQYGHIEEARFIDRPNRFIAHVEKDGRTETVHVINTGRCRELLIPGARVILHRPGTPGRKTEYDLIAVYKNDEILINMDSMAPNRVVREWLEKQHCQEIRPEYTYGESRLDFMTVEQGRKTLLEVKGCTLEMDGIGYFPDAPTDRGVKHLRELIRARGEGWHAAVGFVIQMEGVRKVLPNRETHPEFAETMEMARKAGVEIRGYLCSVRPDELKIIEQVTL